MKKITFRRAYEYQISTYYFFSRFDVRGGLDPAAEERQPALLLLTVFS